MNMKDNPLISIIVPCYKVEKYLPICIESIIRQTYTHLEILLVDDGSPDKSGQICDEYAEKDSRIIVIHKENGGLSDARNVAINQANGEWITFVDSDDFIADNYVETLYGLARELRCDCSVCCLRSFNEGEIPMKRFSLPKKESFPPLKAIELMFYQKKFDHCAQAKLYHRRLFDTGIKYPKGLVFEDMATTYQLLMQSQGVAYTDADLYNYLLRKDSITGNYTPEKIEDGLKVLKMMDDHMEMFHGIEKAYLCRKFTFLMHMLMIMPKTDRHYDEMIADFDSVREEVLLDKHARGKKRIAALLSYLGMDVLKWAYSFVNPRE